MRRQYRAKDEVVPLVSIPPFSMAWLPGARTWKTLSRVCAPSTSY